MQLEKLQVPEHAENYLIIKLGAIHIFRHHQKKKIGEGRCHLYRATLCNEQSPDQKYQRYYIRVEKVVEMLNKQLVFAKMVFPKTISYVFQKPSSQEVRALSLPRESEHLFELEKKLNREAKVVDYDSRDIDSELRQTIEQAIPRNYQSTELWSGGMFFIKTIGESLGKVSGSISRAVSKPVDNAGKSISETASELSRTSIRDQTKQELSKVEEKASYANQAMTLLVAPFVNKCRNVYDETVDNIIKSDNSVITSIRDAGQAFSRSVNEGEAKTLKREEDSEPRKEKMCNEDAETLQN